MKEYPYGYHSVHYDVVYKTGVVKCCFESDMPKTVKDFINYAKKTGQVKVQYDEIFKHDETIYGDATNLKY